MKMISVLFWAVLSLVVFIFTPMHVNGAEKNYKIRFSAYWPPAHHLVKAAEHLANGVKEKTNGRLIIEVYPSGQLYSQKESLKAVSMGSVEMSDELMDKASVVDPLFEVGQTNDYILMEFKDMWAFQDHPVFRQTIESAYEKKLGVRPLMYMMSGSMSFLVNNKRPIKTPADGKGLLLRSSNKAASEKIKLMGGTAVLMDSGEQIMALQRGTVDGSWTSVGDGHSRRIWEVAKYGTVIRILISHPFLINVKYFNNLPPDLRNILLACSKDSEAWGRRQLESMEDGMVKDLSSHMEVHIQTAKEAKEFKELFLPAVEAWLKKTGEKGKLLRDLMIKVAEEQPKK
jgi:TRAP-type C4-dicarboxylate transport system substrate-binding protein